MGYRYAKAVDDAVQDLAARRIARCGGGDVHIVLDHSVSTELHNEIDLATRCSIGPKLSPEHSLHDSIFSAIYWA